MDGLTLDEARTLLFGEPPQGGLAADAEGTSDDAAGGAEVADEAVACRAFDEGNVGLGLDVVEIGRMKALIQRTPTFTARVFSEAEQAYCEGTSAPETHYALRFAAKEAVAKALGTGFAEGIGVRDIEVERAKNGKPSVKLSGRARDIAEERGVRELSISLSYTHHDAVACVMAITEAALRATEKRKDPMEELAKQFKETRGMLDEI